MDHQHTFSWAFRKSYSFARYQEDSPTSPRFSRRRIRPPSEVLLLLWLPRWRHFRSITLAVGWYRSCAALWWVDVERHSPNVHCGRWLTRENCDDVAVAVVVVVAVAVVVLEIVSTRFHRSFRPHLDYRSAPKFFFSVSATACAVTHTQTHRHTPAHTRTHTHARAPKLPWYWDVVVAFLCFPTVVFLSCLRFWKCTEGRVSLKPCPSCKWAGIWNGSQTGMMRILLVFNTTSAAGTSCFGEWQS